MIFLLTVFSYLPTSQIEGEGLASVPGAINLGPIGQSQHVVADDLVARLGEASTIPRLESLNIHTHDELSAY